MGEPRPLLTASWRHLAMLNYAVPPGLLRPLVPAGTELDGWNGDTLASMVGFRFLGARLLGVPLPGHGDFDEVNLRFYVRRRAPDGAWRRAVVFVRELVPRRMIALGARWLYNEPYATVPMRHELAMDTAEDGGPGRVRYAWRSGRRWQDLEVRTRGRPVLPPADSEAAFITEHHWGYTRQRDGGTREYQVAHPRWRVWDASFARLDCDAAALYGPGFGEFLGASPRSAFVAEGSAVAVHAGRRLGV
jgi:uncharacterized protein